MSNLTESPVAAEIATGELVELFQKAASQSHRYGTLSRDAFEALNVQALREIGRPFASLLEISSLAFCRPEPPMIYPKSEVEAQQLWAQGITANLQNLQLRNAFFCKICNAMSSKLGNRVTCSLYLSQPSGASFSWHTDEWEVLCVQVRGEKTFNLLSDASILSTTLSPGDWYRLDPDEMHKASSATISIHLSFGRHRKYTVHNY